MAVGNVTLTMCCIAQVSIYVAVAHQTSHLAPDTRITTNDSSQTAKLGTAYSF